MSNPIQYIVICFTVINLFYSVTSNGDIQSTSLDNTILSTEISTTETKINGQSPVLSKVDDDKEILVLHQSQTDQNSTSKAEDINTDNNKPKYYVIGPIIGVSLLVLVSLILFFLYIFKYKSMSMLPDV